MSGHSKWSTIKHKKSATDKKRGDVFSKMARVLTVAAKSGGDIETNYTLRSAVEKAKNLNMPKDNIERAIKKGTGELAGDQLEELLMEAYGPNGTALLIEVVTDNRNRSTSEIRHILSKNNGKLATGGSVQWLFERQGLLQINQDVIRDKDEFELQAIDAGALDIDFEEEKAFVYVDPQNLQVAQKTLNSMDYTTESGLVWVAKESVEVDESVQKSLQKIFEALDEHEDVQEVYTNAS